MPGGERGAIKSVSGLEHTHLDVLSGLGPDCCLPPPAAESSVASSVAIRPPKHNSSNLASSRAFCTVHPALASKRLLEPHVEGGGAATDGFGAATFDPLDRRDCPDTGFTCHPAAYQHVGGGELAARDP